MAQRRNTFRKDEPMSLRRGGNAPEFTDEQLLIVCVFTTAALQGGFGVYAKLSNDGTSLRLKIYGDDDSYQDNISNRDDMVYLLADYAEQLKFKKVYDGLLATLSEAKRPAPIQAPPDATPLASPNKLRRTGSD